MHKKPTRKTGSKKYTIMLSELSSPYQGADDSINKEHYTIKVKFECFPAYILKHAQNRHARSTRLMQLLKKLTGKNINAVLGGQ